MIIEKLYFKWQRNLNTGKIKLDKVLSRHEIETELEKENNYYSIQSAPNTKLKIDEKGRIEAIFFIKKLVIGEFEIGTKLIHEVKEEFSTQLEICEEDYFGDRLILHFGDSFFKVGSLIRGEKS